MKDKDFDIGNQISFKALADTLGELSDSDIPDLSEIEEEKLYEILSNYLPQMLAHTKTPTKEELYDEIVDNFFFLINELGIDNFSFFRFSNPDYCREIIIDGKEYDLDIKSIHGEDWYGALCAIDSLIGDIVCEYDESEEKILRKIQALINIKNGK